MKLAIEIRGLEKCFRVYPDLVRSRIKQALMPWRRLYKEKIALQDIDLEIRRGEVVGVIGPNGAGKTTLLKIIAGISHPSRGSVTVKGRVIAVLALGLGFHPRLSGLENLELAGMMLGMTRAEVRKRRDWIIDFAELQEYISRPLTSYSMGMKARLSFAIAACQEPEILIIDEALATGDVRFVQKCISRIHEITRSGSTALFVSHNIWSIKKLTQRCLLLDAGRLVDDGDTGRVCDRYYEVMLRNEVFEFGGRVDSGGFVGSGEVKVVRVRLRQQTGEEATVVMAGEPATIELDVEAVRDCADVGVSLVVWRSDGVCMTALGSVAGGALDERMQFREARLDLRRGRSTIQVELQTVLLAPGDYSVEVHLFDAGAHSGYTSMQQYYFKPRLLEFAVRRLGNPNREIAFYQPASVAVKVPNA